MSDARLRALERRWRETGAPADQRRWLGERIRRGLVPRERVLLAAYLGHPAARDALGARGFPEERDLGAWVRGLGRGRLGRHGDLVREACRRAALAAAETARAAWEGAGVDTAVLDRALAAVRAPDLEERSAEEIFREVHFTTDLEEDDVASAAFHLVGTFLSTEPEAAAGEAARVAEACAQALKGRERHHRKAVRAAIEAALLPWVLDADG